MLNKKLLGKEVIAIDIYTEIGVLLMYAFAIFSVYFLGYFFLVPIKLTLKLILNSILGGIFLILLNFCGNYLNFHIALNLLTAAIVGILGIPGTIGLILFEFV